MLRDQPIGNLHCLSQPGPHFRLYNVQDLKLFHIYNSSLFIHQILYEDFYIVSRSEGVVSLYRHRMVTLS
jgi:hypothetical protein